MQLPTVRPGPLPGGQSFRATSVNKLLRHVALLCLALLLSACGSTEEAAGPSRTAVAQAQPSPTVTAPTAAAEPTPTRSGPTPTPTLEPGTFRNPVINQDFPDPDLLKVGDTYYAYATNTGSYNIQVARSQDLVNWQVLTDALPSLPPWAEAGFTWAPEVTSVGEQRYVMYFTARHSESQRQCIGTALAESPEGPFESQEQQPFICQLEQGGSIDASSFVAEDGARFVLWKNDGNCCGQDTWIYLQQVSADGLALQGEPTQLIQQGQAWEGALVEAPTLWQHDEKYYLFYSANSYNTERYAVGYAVADQVLGPYTKAAEPILETDFEDFGAFGPGGQDVVIDDDGETWLAYHSWDWTVSYRAMQIDELVWEAGAPLVLGPDKGAQAVP